GVLEDRKRLGASAHVHDVREDRLLRLIAEQARNRTWRRERPSDHSLCRARRGLELVLPRRGGVYVPAAVGPARSASETEHRLVSPCYGEGAGVLKIGSEGLAVRLATTTWLAWLAGRRRAAARTRPFR